MYGINGLTAYYGMVEVSKPRPGRDSLGVQRRRLQLAINHLDTVVDRTELTGIAGVRIWFGHSVSAHNLVRISTLAA